MRYGTIPIVHATGGLRDTVQDYNPDSLGLRLCLSFSVSTLFTGDNPDEQPGEGQAFKTNLGLTLFRFPWAAERWAHERK